MLRVSLNLAVCVVHVVRCCLFCSCCCCTGIRNVPYLVRTVLLAPDGEKTTSTCGETCVYCCTCVCACFYRNPCSCCSIFQDLNRCIDKIELVDYHQVLEHEGIKFWCYNAGHVLGAAMFMIEIAVSVVCREEVGRGGRRGVPRFS